MVVPKVMLLVNGTPELDHVGETFLRTLCSHVPPGKLCRFSLTLAKPDLVSGEWLGFPVAAAKLFQEYRFRKLGRSLSRWASLPVNLYVRHFYVKNLISQAVKFGRAERVEQVWAVLNTPQVIYMAKEVAIRLRVPLVVTVWDPPERLAYDLNMDPFSKRHVQREFANIMHSAVRFGLASDNMREEYRKQFDIESVVLIQGIDPQLRHPPAEGPPNHEPFIIGFAGSSYGNREFLALLSALSSVGWRLQGREVIVRVLSKSLAMQSTCGMHIEYLGWRSMEETIALLSQVDVTYLPYWFDPVHSTWARLCFPNKLSTYLASGRPVLVHAPTYASPIRFMERFPIGIGCHSLHEPEIVRTLERFITEPESYQSMAQASKAAFEQELDLSVFLQRFSYLTGIQEQDR